MLHDEVLEVLSCWRLGGDFEYEALEKSFAALSQEMMASTCNDELVSAVSSPDRGSPEPGSEDIAEESSPAQLVGPPEGLPPMDLRTLTQDDVDRLNAEFRHRPPMDAIRWLMISLGA
jgi:hypothetical protein